MCNWRFHDKRTVVVKGIDDARRVCGDRSVSSIGHFRNNWGLYLWEFLGALIPYEIWEMQGLRKMAYQLFIEWKDCNIYNIHNWLEEEKIIL